MAQWPQDSAARAVEIDYNSWVDQMARQSRAWIKTIVPILIGGYTHNREFGLDAARAGRLEFPPSLLRRPILAGVQATGRHDTDTESSQSASR